MSEIKAVLKLSLVEGQVVLCHRDDLNGQFLLKKTKQNKTSPDIVTEQLIGEWNWTGVYGILFTTALQI